MKLSPRTRTLSTATLATALLAPMLIAASPADASGGGGGGAGVKASGKCTGGGTWKLKAKHDDSKIQVEYEVDTNVVGQVWKVKLTDNGVTIFSGNAKTVAPSGSFTVSRLTPNRAGSDKISATATLGARVCSGSLVA